METQPYPQGEWDRLSDFERLNKLDLPLERRYERIARLALRTFHATVATIDINNQRPIHVGSDPTATAVAPAAPELSSLARSAPGPLLVNDAGTDPFFANHREAISKGAIGFFAWAPVRAPDGQPAGHLCLTAPEPRQLDPAARDALTDFAGLVEDEMRIGALTAAQTELVGDVRRLQRQVRIDDLTQVWSRAGILEILNREFERARRQKQRLAVALVDLDNFKSVNDTHGHSAGDIVLRAAAERMVDAVRPYDAVGRYGGEEFLVVIVEDDVARAQGVAERIREHIVMQPVSAAGAVLQVSASVGFASNDFSVVRDAMGLVRLADDALYLAKARGRNRVAFSTDSSASQSA